MKAAIVTSFIKNIDEIQVVDNAPVPVVTPGHALVKVHYAGLNPVDLLLTKGYLEAFGWHTPLPYTLGVDFSGEVSALGDGTEGLTVGDKVFSMKWGQNQPHDNIPEPLVGGAIAEYLLIPAHKLTKVPDGVGMDQAASLGVTASTAYGALFDVGQVVAGTKVLILGGSSAVGIIAVQLAKQAGAYVATTCSSRTTSTVSQLGADLVVDYTVADWAAHADIQGYDIIFGCVHEQDGLSRAQQGALKADGKFISIADTSVGFNPLGHAPLTYAGYYTVSQSPAIQATVVDMVAKGIVKVVIDEIYPLTSEGVGRAYAKVESGKSVGKNLIQVL